MNNLTQQYKWENESWKRSCEYLVQEIVDMKNRLASILKNDVSGELLENIESLQNDLLQKDTVLQLMRSDINSTSKLFSDINEQDSQLNGYTLQHEKMRKEVIKLQKKIIDFKAHFNEVLLEKI
jgi:hypothetical protein